MFKKYLGIALLPQAGVAIGMAQLSLTALPEYGEQIRAIILCGTLIYELIGPVLTRMALTAAGEIERKPKKTESAKDKKYSAFSVYITEIIKRPYGRFYFASRSIIFLNCVS